MIGHFLAVPAAADPELETASAQRVHAGHFLGGSDRIALDQETDAAAHPEPGRCQRRRGQGDEQIVGPHILLG